MADDQNLFPGITMRAKERLLARINNAFIQREPWQARPPEQWGMQAVPQVVAPVDPLQYGWATDWGVMTSGTATYSVTTSWDYFKPAPIIEDDYNK